MHVHTHTHVRACMQDTDEQYACDGAQGQALRAGSLTVRPVVLELQDRLEPSAVSRLLGLENARR